MAKARQSPALFEVIARSRPHNGRAASGLLGSVTRWFRWKRNGTTNALSNARPTPVARPLPISEASPPPVPAPIDVAPLPSRRTAITIDPDRYEITLRLSYVYAIICLFAVVTLVAGAFVAGSAGNAQTHPQLANDPNSPLPADGVPRVLKIEKMSVSAQPSANGEPAITSQQPATETHRSPGPLSRTRKPGLNYVIVQSYPEEKMANDAVKILSENGIDSTVERNIQGWLKDWYIVIGLEGFDRISNAPRYEAYMKKIRDISEKYTKKNSFKAFAPTAIKWPAKTK